MARIDIYQWNGIRRLCSVCRAEGIPRACGCAPAHVEDWHGWVTVTDITVMGWWPSERFERVACAERLLRS